MLRLIERFALVTAVTLVGLCATLPATSLASNANGQTHRGRMPIHARPAGESVLYTFTGGLDGMFPYAGVVADAAGNLYGTTIHGGTAGSTTYGTVFKLVPSGSTYTESILYAFQGGADGQYPFGGVILDKHGALYGTTFQGGTNGVGTVFKLTPGPSGYTKTILYSFQGGSDGVLPYAGLYMAADGSLFGTTEYGGGSPSGGAGTVFKLTPSGSTYTESIIYAFQGGNDGAMPAAPVMGDAHGALYGTTVNGNKYNAGTVYKLTPNGSGYAESLIYSFQPFPDGAHPYGGLIGDGSGAIYGATLIGGGYNAGMVFKLTPSGSTYARSVLYVFDGCGFSSPTCDGADPEAALYMDASCSLYGTTQYGAPDGVGTVFRLSPSIKPPTLAGSCRWAGGTYTETLPYGFQGGSDGKNPNSTLIELNGLLYGTSFYGGGSNDGTVFRLTP